MEDGLSCPACGGAIAQPTPHCPHCGARMLLTTGSAETDESIWEPDPGNPDDLKSTFVRQPKAKPKARMSELGPLTTASDDPPQPPKKGAQKVLLLIAVIAVVCGILGATGII